jgi:hypothetical protein
LTTWRSSCWQACITAYGHMAIWCCTKTLTLSCRSRILSTTSSDVKAGWLWAGVL